jgi:hypothetical protein
MSGLCLVIMVRVIGMHCRCAGDTRMFVSDAMCHSVTAWTASVILNCHWLSDNSDTYSQAFVAKQEKQETQMQYVSTPWGLPELPGTCSCRAIVPRVKAYSEHNGR